MSGRTRTRRNVTFLLGSGVSASVLPLPAAINRLVMSGRWNDREMVRCSDARYGLFEPNAVVGDGRWLIRVRAFLARLAIVLGDDDYELLFFVCQQVHDHLAEEYENPPLQPFIVNCLADLRDWWGPDSYDQDPRPPESKLAELAREAQNYIGGAVAAVLEHSKDAATQLRGMHAPLLSACRAPGLNVDVITLNHDLLLEASLRQARIAFEDGFRQRGDIAVWTGYKLSGGPKVRLIKLHGSIDEWSYKRPTGEAVMVRVGYPFRTQLRADRLQDTYDYKPRMLIGTTNKMLDYLKPVNLDRLAVFRRALIGSRGLVVAGYGFRDKGVNGLLVDWFWSKRMRVVVVDPSLAGHHEPPRARYAALRAWRMLVERRRLLPIGRKFSEVTWRELRQYVLA